MHPSIWIFCILVPLIISMVIYWNSPTVQDLDDADDRVDDRADDRAVPAPQPFVFTVAWTCLYLLMGLSLALVLNQWATGKTGSLTVKQAWSQPNKTKTGFALTGVTLFVALLILNWSYLVVNFKIGDEKRGQTILYVMIGVAALTTMCFLTVSPMAATLLLPLIGWLTYASYLQKKEEKKADAESAASDKENELQDPVAT